MNRELEFRLFSENWVNKPIPQVAEEYASWRMETHDLPDPYPFLIIEDKLISPETMLPVENSIQVTNEVERQEFEGFQKIQSWATSEEMGYCIWISPDGPYPTSKVIIHHKESSERLFNRSIKLGINLQGCNEIAKNLVDHPSCKSEMPANHRSTPLILDDSLGIEELLMVMKIPPESWVSVTTGEDIRQKQAAIEDGKKFAQELKQDKRTVYTSHQYINALGSGGSTCPPPPGKSGAFNAMLNNSRRVESSFPCPKCDFPIPSGKGITTCPNCGITKEEVGSACD